MRAILCLIVLGLAGCDSKPGTPSEPVAPAPSATPDAVPEVAEPSSDPPKPEAKVDMALESGENQLVKAEVLDRVDVMPNLSDEEKDKLYVLVERARGMGRLVTIPFRSGRRALGSADIAAIKATLPQFKNFTDDPTVVFVVLGFADKEGDPAGNIALSRERAESVVNALKKQCGILNVTHSLGMGSSEMFDAKDLEKNRVVEIWAVLP